MNNYELFYAKMLGECRLEEKDPQVIRELNKLFTDGAPCDIMEEQAYQARVRLARRLHTDIEDHDLLDMVEGYEKMHKALFVAMYAMMVNAEEEKRKN